MVKHTQEDWQDWTIGERVKVGSLTLRVVRRSAGPGGLISYTLASRDGLKRYEFVPRND